MLARMGRLLPDEGVDIGDKLGRRAVAKGADAVDEERLALWKNGRHRIVEGSCDRIAVQPPARLRLAPAEGRSEEHTSKLQSLMRISYAVFCLKKKTKRENRYRINTDNTNAHKQHITHIATNRHHNTKKS